MDVLSNCSAVPSPSRPCTTCRISAQGVAIPQFRWSSSPSPPPTAPAGPAGAPRLATMTIASRAPASTSCTCAVDTLLPKEQTVVQQGTGLAPPMGCRWSSDCLHPPPRPHLLSSRHTSRLLAACCTRLPSSIPALSHSEGEDDSVIFGALRHQDKKCIYLTS